MSVIYLLPTLISNTSRVQCQNCKHFTNNYIGRPPKPNQIITCPMNKFGILVVRIRNINLSLGYLPLLQNFL